MAERCYGARPAGDVGLPLADLKLAVGRCHERYVFLEITLVDYRADVRGCVADEPVDDRHAADWLNDEEIQQSATCAISERFRTPGASTHRPYPSAGTSRREEGSDGYETLLRKH
jgi:hypothetical protein